MLAVVRSATLAGFEGIITLVEVNVTGGFPHFEIVGLADTAVKESRERVRAALANNGFRLPRGRITVNLAPAAIRKHGPALDLPIALGILLASRQLPPAPLVTGAVICGELSLEGRVRPVRGVLPMALAALKNNCTAMVVPGGNQHEAAALAELKVYGLNSLNEIVEHCQGDTTLKPAVYTRPGPDQWAGPDLAEVKGQQGAKRALEVAAAGGHNLLFQGPPGAGKTMLANCLPGILPPLTRSQSLEVSQVYSIAGLLPPQGLLSWPPFRNPHHSASTAGIGGGGSQPRPGEISLAHHGVLYLDEFPEFRREVIEMLRQPMEEGEITIVRSHGAYTFPARFLLVAAANPCPCGYYGVDGMDCRCTAGQIHKYRSKLSGPILDRIDIWAEVPQLEYDKLRRTGDGERSDQVRRRVAAARETQARRFKGRRFATNGAMEVADVDRFCQLEPEAEALMAVAFKQYRFSARAYQRLLKVGRTIADLAGDERISGPAMAEALSYRTLFGAEIT